MTDPFSSYDYDDDVMTQSDNPLPPLYVIVMHNDHYTTMEFVVYVLMTVFDYELQKAVNTMMDVHEKGQAHVAVFPKEIAEMKIAQVDKMAQEAEYPLRLTMHKND